MHIRNKPIPLINVEQPVTDDSRLRDKIAGYMTQEIVLGVVGYAGSGTSFVTEYFSRILEEEGFTPYIVSARNVLDEWANHHNGIKTGSAEDETELITEYQNLGDKLRKLSGEYGAVAGWMVRVIHNVRRENKGDQKHVFFLDSLKHPAEVELLRQIYGDGFRLIGVGCRPDVRQRRLELKSRARKEDSTIRILTDRDAEDSINRYGQQVNKTFHLSDYFVDNTVNAEQSAIFVLPDTLKEVFDKLFTRTTYHPSRDERGLYFADAAATSSACLSRQVGAAILDRNGNLLAVGRNDVPKAYGGLYDNDDENSEGLCCERGICSNKVYQDQIAADIISIFDGENIPQLGDKSDEFLKALNKTRMGSLIEFSRSVHAEMDALISLTRTGTRLSEDSTLYTTTYPCHNCARHIVASGIKKVVYLEPYSKSLACDLHDDAIADNLPMEETGSRVIFQPYIGVSPRLFQTIYRQSGDRKDTYGKALQEEKGRTLRSRLSTLSFNDLENECEKFVEEIDDDN